jgi:hypothetical protein
VLDGRLGASKNIKQQAVQLYLKELQTNSAKATLTASEATNHIDAELCSFDEIFENEEHGTH